MAGILLLGRPTSVFNGGRSQTNLNQIGVGGHEFLNCFKTGQGWVTISPVAQPNPSVFLFDTNGYPTAIASGGVSCLFICPQQFERPGNYIVDWLGTGTMSILAGSFVSGSLTSATSAGGSFIFTPPNNGRPQIGITAIGSSSDYINRLRVYHVDDAADMAAGKILGSKFREKMAELKFGVIRFLNWGGRTTLNFGLNPTWSLRRPLDYAYYGFSEIRTSIYAGETTNTGDAFSITSIAGYVAGSGPMTHGQCATIKWSDTGAGTPTLSWNGGPAKRILTQACRPQFGNTGNPGSGAYGTIMYDSTLDAYIHHGSSVAGTSIFLDNGVPPEFMIEAAAELGMHLDFPIPYNADVDYTTNFATMCKNHFSASWMKPIYEGPNELWNSIFYGALYASAHQSVRNGCTWSNGVQTIPSYSPTAVSGVSGGQNINGRMTITLGAHSFTQGSFVTLSGTWTGLNGAGFNGSAVNVPVVSIAATTITVAWAPTAGTYSSGGTVSAFAGNLAAATNGDYHGWYGRFMSEHGQAVAAVYGVSLAQVKTQTEYEFFCGVQTTVTPANFNERLLSSGYVLETGDSNNQASNWITGVRPANYFKSSYYGTGTETTILGNFAPVGFTATFPTATTMSVSAIAFGSGTLAAGHTVFGWNVPAGTAITSQASGDVGGIGVYNLDTNQTVTSVGNGYNSSPDMTQTDTYLVGVDAEFADIVTYFSGWKLWAQGTGITIPTWGAAISIQRMAPYEGGYSPDYTPDQSTTTGVALTCLRYSLKINSGMQAKLTSHYADLDALTDVTFTFMYPSHYLISGRYPSAQAWALMETIYQSPNPPMAEAIKAYNS